MILNVNQQTTTCKIEDPINSIIKHLKCLTKTQVRTISIKEDINGLPLAEDKKDIGKLDRIL